MPTSAYADDELAGLDATATAAAVAAGGLSPTEAVEAAIARAERLDPLLGAVVRSDYQRARRAAARLTADGAGGDAPFAGVPMFVKDNADVAGLPTCHGSAALVDAAPAASTEGLVQQMFDMGMVGLGKTTLPEFGFAPSCELLDGTATHNPWNLQHSAGGSSSGSAALVAAGVVPIAHGADGGGSIRIPAACCGLVGLKPTRGRLLPSPDSRKMPVDIVAEGVLTRSVRDTAAYLAAAERRYRDPSLPPVGEVSRPLGRSLRVGVVSDSPLGTPLDRPTRVALERTVALLERLGHHAESVHLPDTERFAEDFKHYWSMLVFSVAVGGHRLYDPSFDKARLTPFTLGMARRFRRSIWRTPANLVRMRRSTARYRHLFDRHDVLVSPTITTVAPPLGHLASDLPYEVLLERLERWVSFTPLANATGMPSISLPLGHDDDTDLPVGVLFSAPTGADGMLLELALQLEDAQPFRSLVG